MDDSSLKGLLEHLPVFWWEVDEPWQVLERGGGAFADTGTAQRFLDRMHEERASSGHPPQEARWQARFDGRTFDVSWPPEEDGARSRTRGLAVEVDAHPEVPRRYAAFADLVDLAPAAAFIRDREGRYLWANHAYAHLYGTTPAELAGKRIEDFDAPAEAARFRALDQEILTLGTPVRHTLGYRRPDGSAGQAVGHRFPVRENAQTCVAGIYVDITDHLRTLVQRQEAEEHLQALRDHSGLPCALLSANGRVVEASTAAAELFRLSLPDLVGRRAHTLLAPDPELGRLHRRWHGLIARRTRRVETSTVLVDAEGRLRRAQLHLTTVGHSAARARHVWAVVTHQSLAHDAHPSLTAAQVRILSLLAEGSTNSDIATSLRLSRQTVDYHLSRLRQLLGAATRPALVARAYVLGILAPRAWPPRSATAPHPLSTV
ncbi:PAS domain S-box protein [Streptomyces sp. NPDC005562]|uniref:PAS domain S-box protein n=1 Tax=Streptomyces sp. NPDC005562 TaxID=3154890 RepID=UPI0033ACA4F9